MDDLGFVAYLVTYMEENFCIDAERIFATVHKGSPQVRIPQVIPPAGVHHLSLRGTRTAGR